MSRRRRATPPGSVRRRSARIGVKVGPLFADDEETAEALFSALVAAAPAGVDVVVDVPREMRSATRSPDLLLAAGRHGTSARFRRPGQRGLNAMRERIDTVGRFAPLASSLED